MIVTNSISAIVTYLARISAYSMGFNCWDYNTVQNTNEGPVKCVGFKTLNLILNPRPQP